MPLTPEQLDTLRVELQEPPYIDLLAAGNDAVLADRLNAQALDGRRWVPTDVLRAHLMTQGIWPRLRTVLYTEAAPAELKGAAHFVIDACVPTALEALDLDAALCGELLAVFQDASLLTADEAGAILALGDAQVSRAEQLFGAGVTVSRDDVAGAR
jgi:hypothetical protein